MQPELFIVNYLYFKIIDDKKKFFFVIYLQHYVLSVFSMIIIQNEWKFLKWPTVAMVTIPGE